MFGIFSVQRPDNYKSCPAFFYFVDLYTKREEFRDRLDVVFIEVWKNPEAKKPYNIRLIPTQILFDAAGRELWRHEGFISKEDLKAVFEKAGVE